MAKRTKPTKRVARKQKISAKNAPPSTKSSTPTEKPSTPPVPSERTNPYHRGIHHDALRTGRAPTSAATCVACDASIPKGSARWGLKYAGNPLAIPVLPLYGSHPMVLWCHGGNCCGLSFRRYSDMNDDSPAARTCHACQDAPDDANTNHNNIRLLCGGVPKGKKVRHHVFHIGCWIKIVENACDDSSLANELAVDPRDIGKTTTKLRTLGGLSWEDLTPGERRFVLHEFEETK